MEWHRIVHLVPMVPLRIYSLTHPRTLGIQDKVSKVSKALLTVSADTRTFAH